MTPLIIPAIFVLFVTTAWFIGTYNRFIKYKNRIEEAWSGIDVALKRRYNLIPNLIKIIEGYSEHESRLLKREIDEVQGAADLPERVEEESRLSRTLRGTLAWAEAYPDLKASENFLALQRSLDEIEADIQRARQLYNRYIGRFNTLVESFPALYIARRFNFEKQDYFSLELATQRALPEVEFNKSSDSKKGKR